MAICVALSGAEVLVGDWSAGAAADPTGGSVPPASPVGMAEDNDDPYG